MHQRSYLLPCLVLAILVPAATAFPRTAAALAPADTKALDVRVEATLGEAEEQKLAASVRDAVVDRLRARDIEISDDAPSTLLLTLGWLGKSRSDLEVKYIVTEHGGEPKELRKSVCAACGSREVIAAIDSDLEPIWATLEKAATVTKAEPTPETAPTTPPPAPVADTKERNGKRRTIGGLGLAGAAVGAVGLGVLGAGAVMWGIGYSYPEDNPDIRKNLKKPGIGMVAAGGAMTIAGIAMLAVDLTRDKRERRVAAAPVFGPRGAGVTLAVRW
jgi:hypothetical protein